MKNLRKGFTLVEMLIVVVIIGILAAALLPRLMGAQGATRDTARKTALNQIVQGLELYNVNNGYYPTGLGTDQMQSTEKLQSVLVPNYLKNVPVDPNKTAAVSIITGAGASAVSATQWHFVIAKKDSKYYLAAKVEKPENANWASDVALNEHGLCSSVTVDTSKTSSEVTSASNKNCVAKSNDNLLYVLPIN